MYRAAIVPYLKLFLFKRSREEVYVSKTDMILLHEKLHIRTNFHGDRSYELGLLMTNKKANISASILIQIEDIERAHF